MASDVPWICRDNHHSFKLRSMVHQSAIDDNRKVQCPRCGSWDTGPAKTTSFKNEGLGKHVSPHVDKLLEPPTLPQLYLINKLGGDAHSVKTKGEAGELISRLKKQKGQ